MKLQNLLIPYDGTRYSENVIKEGIKLANIFDSKITIHFVIEKRFFLKPYIQANENLKQESKAKELLNFVKNNNIDVIIMGRKGYHGLSWVKLLVVSQGM